MKNKIKKFIALAITLITTLIFTISTFAQSGFEVKENGNIQSLNLFNINNVADGSNGNINTSTGIVNGYDSKTVFNFQVQYITSNYNYYTIYSVDVTSPQVKTYTFTKTSEMYWLQFGHNGSSADIKVRYDIHELENTTYTISINIISITNPQSFNNIMLNKGNYLEYFPYGNYTNNKNIGNNGQIYEQLNGTTAKLFQTNITNINTAINTQGIIEETININNQTSYTWNSSSIPTIENCIINYNPAINLSNRATVLLQLENATMFDNLTFTRIDKNEDRYIYLYNENKKLITTLTIARKVETITHII